MTTNQQRSTVVGVFEQQDDAERAVDELTRAGFTANEVGFAGHDKSQAASGEQAENMAKGATAGLIPGGVVGGVIGAVATGLIPGVGPIIGAGILAGVLGGAATGAAAGGILGALTGMGVSEDEAQYYEGEFKAGRTLVTVKAEGRYDEAAAILRRNGAYDTDSRASGGVPNSGMTAGTQRTGAQSGTMELREEQLRARTEPVQTGEARIGKEVVEETKTVDVPVSREEVIIDRRPVQDGRPASGSIGDDQEVRVPVHEDQVRVDKDTVVREEIDVEKRTVDGTEHVEENVRREEPRIDDAGAGQRRVS